MQVGMLRLATLLSVCAIGVSTSELEMSLAGCWTNELESIVWINVSDAGFIEGSYMSKVSASGTVARGDIVGFQQDVTQPTFGFVVKWAIGPDRPGYGWSYPETVLEAPWKSPREDFARIVKRHFNFQWEAPLYPEPPGNISKSELVRDCKRFCLNHLEMSERNKLYQLRGSVTVWAGQYYNDGAEEQLTTMWLLRKNRQDSKDNWEATLAGMDVFTRANPAKCKVTDDRSEL